MRWRHENGILNASEFIPLTDNTPLSGMLTYSVFDTVAVELGDWLLGNVSVHVSINLSPQTLGRGGLEYAVTADSCNRITLRERWPLSRGGD